MLATALQCPIGTAVFRHAEQVGFTSQYHLEVRVVLQCGLFRPLR